MRVWKTLFAIVLSAVMSASTACVHRVSDTMQAWVGSSEADLVSAWGAPIRAIPLTNGGRVLTWTRGYRLADTPMTCEQSFTISPAGVVTAWSAHGC